jgi:hypothetical protein
MTVMTDPRPTLEDRLRAFAAVSALDKGDAVTCPRHVFAEAADELARLCAENEALAAPQVPREPTATAEMCLAGIGAWHHHYWPDLSPTEHTWSSPTIMCMAKIWRAMYDAAPAQPDSSERGDSQETMRVFRDAVIEECAKVCEKAPDVWRGEDFADHVRALKREGKS